ncbi:MAG TPA: hypothetical protein VHZ55_16110 [Bryobacteraceae bacterium]|nr:hypothetical protein [Bryobacteraceae bacterium]
MRDTFGDADPQNDRLTAVWLLSYIRPSIGKRMLSAVPFFYWTVGDGAVKVSNKTPAPLLDMTSLQHPMFSRAGRDILQWGLLDSSTLPVRATSRAYNTNESDNERLHLEEAESYLRSAPLNSDPSGLTATQLRTLIARLELRKTLIGGLASETAAKRMGEESSIKYDAVLARNWELLRECADKTGLYFEPLTIAGTANHYAVLWFPLDDNGRHTGSKLGPIWKLLGIKDPSADTSLRSNSSSVYQRALDEAGGLLPIGIAGAREIRVIPLGVYSLTYPKQPLLVLDFRTRLHLRWHEVSQRSINEITAGVIGISHFTNWYYYVAADAYDFIASRHGGAVNQYERLDCYSQFRAKLQLDHELDARLRGDMVRRVGALAINPLESNPENEMRAAIARYVKLTQAATDGGLVALVEKDRRAELVQDGESPRQIARDNLEHLATLGIYTHRAKAGPSTNDQVDCYRRAQYQLSFLDGLTQSGTRPEVAYQAQQIQQAIRILQKQMPAINSRTLREHATATLRRVNELSHDEALRNDSSTALASIQARGGEVLDRVALKPSAVHALPADFRPLGLGADGLR